MHTYDLAVIGSGPAGEKAAIQGADAGAKVVIIEKNAQPGGASLITGTIPSKAMRETVQYLKTLNNKALYGFEATISPGYSMREVMHRKNVVIEKRASSIMETYRHKGITYLKGNAYFKNEHQLLIRQNDEGAFEINASKIIIAAGTKPYRPPDIIFDNQCIHDSDTLLNLENIPASICVFGGGVIGCEYATIFASLGSLVTLVDPRGTLLNFLDEDISHSLAHYMRRMNINIRLGEDYDSIQKTNEHVEIHLKSGKNIKSSVLLYANGRQGLAGQLGLEELGIEVNNRSQLNVDQYFRTSIPHIYAVGDIIGFPSLASTSIEQGRLAGRHAISGEMTPYLVHNSPLGIYTIPEISMVGQTEEQLTKNKIPYEAGTCQFEDLARINMLGDYRGMLKILFHLNTKEILGVHIIGVGASEIIHIGQAVIHYKGTLDYFLEEVINYPTISQAYKIAALNGIERIRTIH